MGLAGGEFVLEDEKKKLNVKGGVRGTANFQGSGMGIDGDQEKKVGKDTKGGKCRYKSEKTVRKKDWGTQEEPTTPITPFESRGWVLISMFQCREKGKPNRKEGKKG